MKKVELLNLNGEKVKDFKLNENIFDITPNDKVLYDAIILARASLRQSSVGSKVQFRSNNRGYPHNGFSGFLNSFGYETPLPLS